MFVHFIIIRGVRLKTSMVTFTKSKGWGNKFRILWAQDYKLNQNLSSLIMKKNYHYEKKVLATFLNVAYKNVGRKLMYLLSGSVNGKRTCFKFVYTIV